MSDDQHDVLNNMLTCKTGTVTPTIDLTILEVSIWEWKSVIVLKSKVEPRVCLE